MLARMVVRLEGQPMGKSWGISPVLSPAAKLDPAVRPVSGLTSHLGRLIGIAFPLQKGVRIQF
jgi:hypothetical protein